MLDGPILQHVILSAALFLFVWQVLGRGVFKPFFEVIEEREAKTSGSEDLAHRKRDELKRLNVELAVSLQEARLQGLTSRDELVQRAKLEAQTIRENAMASASEEIALAKVEIERLKLRAQGDLLTEIERISDLLVGRALEGPSGRVVH
jgi:F0F1-type ATP synthase membrane subunit b/b'